MTVEQIIRRIRRRISESLESGTWENELDYIPVINTIVQDIVKDTNCMPTEVSYDSVATREIDLLATHNILSILSIMDKSNGAFLEKCTQEWLWANKGENWLTAEGDPEGYYEKGIQVGFYPFELGHSYTFKINQNPTDVTQIADIPFGGRLYLYPWHSLIIFGVASFFYEEIERALKPIEIINFQTAQARYITGKDALKTVMIGGIYGPASLSHGIPPQTVNDYL